MIDVNADRIASVVEVIRSLVTDWDGFIRQIESLTREHEQLRGRSEWQEQQLRELAESLERARREAEESARTLAELRAEHQTVLREHEDLLRSHRELCERSDGLRRDREYAAEELEALLRRLKP